VISQFLNSLCDQLYDSLRPRILHEPNVETLCRLSGFLATMMADYTGEDDSESQPRGTNSERLKKSRPVPLVFARRDVPNKPSRFRFDLLLQGILEDVQTRLLFRSNAIIQSEVLHFVPTQEDLDYPARLEKFEKNLRTISSNDWIPSSNHKQGDYGYRPEIPLPDERFEIVWYPTLVKTIGVLEQLHLHVAVSLIS
jgi:conserved oligomeric Golgi complex subunit 3